MTEKHNAHTLFLPTVSLCEGQALKNHSNLLQNTVFIWYPFFYCMKQHRSGQWQSMATLYKPISFLFDCQMQIYLSGFLLFLSQLRSCLATVIVNKHSQAWGILSVPTKGTQERNVLWTVQLCHSIYFPFRRSLIFWRIPVLIRLSDGKNCPERL